MQTLSIIKPDDWHLHLRDGSAMQSVVNDSARQFERAIIMPNLVPPVTSCALAEAYYQRIIQALQPASSFTPLMTLYLTDHLEPKEIELASQSKHIFGAKLYPAGATTNSDSGVTRIRNIFPVLDAMQQHDFPLLVHGEVTDPEIDIFDREKRFIDTTLSEIRVHFPRLRIILEHITTLDAIEFIQQANEFTAASVTAHHLLINRNALFKGGMNPHHYCLPIAKRELHREALVEAVTTDQSGRFFAGTDSAPHPRHAKESSCGCAGIYTAHAAIELYAQAFESSTAGFERFEAFMSLNGANFYQLPVNQTYITLVKKTWQVPELLGLGNDPLVPFMAGKTLSWQLDSKS